ncbi:Hypothetical predicted protein [Lecanosticta acicola]|uniref:Uncharacterized protein n=1 Tax=Lecanosticta acicola TaxID=111012 RepID=A0AAI8W1Q2_9PEZI|nr:Hypothetical predicted protein [Lecanosticta acicola]
MALTITSMLSRRTWANSFDLALGATARYTLPQTLARAIHNLTILYPSPSNHQTIIAALKYVRRHIQRDPTTLVKDMDLSANEATEQLEMDLLLGIGNCFVAPAYCDWTAEASWENAVKCKGLFGILAERVRMGTIDGREGDGVPFEGNKQYGTKEWEGRKEREVSEEVDLEVPEPNTPREDKDAWNGVKVVASGFF